MLAMVEAERRKRRASSALSFRGAAQEAQEIQQSEWIISGPAETGKTFASMYRLHTLMQQYPKARAVIVRKVRMWLYETALKTWERVVEHGSLKPKKYGGVRPFLYVYPNGSQVYIAGLDVSGSVLSGEFDFVYVNQTEELDIKDWETLTTRTTGRGSVAPYTMLFGDCNPGDEEHWILSRAQAGNLKLLRSYHKDNPSLYKDGDWTAQGHRTMQTLQSLTGSRYAKLFLGEWIRDDGPESFLPSLAMWDQCQSDDIPRLSNRQPMVIALDAAITGDTFAMVGVTRDPDNNEESTIVRLARVWIPNNQPLDYQEIEREIRDVLNRYNVVQIAYDPYQLHYFAQRLNDVVWTEPFNQGSDRLESDMTLRTLIIQRRIKHDGTHAVIREHLANADAKVDESGHKLRIVKRAAHLKIDAAVALAMANYRTLELNMW
jgi:hypothetical protein